MEQKIIGWLARSFLDKKIPVGIGLDDAALVDIPKKQILLSCDMLIEGTHFRSKEDPVHIGRKAASVSLSDIAAMGGEPLYLLVSLGLPRRYGFSDARKIFQGIRAALSPYRAKLVGGDTVRSRFVVVDTTIVGYIKEGKVLTRSGARPGDSIFATGCFGDSLRTGWHYRFTPRIKEMEYLRKKIRITSAMDASDGLHASLRTLSQRSGAGFDVACGEIKSRVAKKDFLLAVDSALFDGEDFELVFTGRCPDAVRTARDFEKKFKVPLSVIGKVRKGAGVKFFDRESREVRFENREFRHFTE
jgi:thiamine-monophosphate kinase